MNTKKAVLLLVIIGLIFCITLVTGCDDNDTATEYQLSYSANNAAATGTAPQGGSYAEGASITLAANAFALADYEFTGWSDGTNTYQAGAAFTMPNKDVELKAQWTAVAAPKYQLSYSANNAAATGTAPQGGSYAEGASITLAANAFALADYEFTGWNDGTNTYKAGAAFTMPNKDVELKAQWAKVLIVSFNTNGGDELTPIEVCEGKGIAYSDLPVATQEGSVFLEWCIDGELTVRYDSDVHTFTENTTLYARFAELPVLGQEVYAQNETTLLNQSPELTLSVVGNGELNESNLGDHLNVTTLSGEAPDFTISGSNGEYALSPDGLWTEGGSYALELTSPFRFAVEAEGEELAVSLLNLTIASPKKETATVSQSIVSVERADYLSFDGTTLILKNDSASAMNLAMGQTVGVTTMDGVAYCKVVSLSALNVGSVSALSVTLDACELSDVYENLEVYEQTTVSPSELIESVTVNDIISQVKNDADLNKFIHLSACAVNDYAASNGIAFTKVVSYDIPEIKVDVYSTLNDVTVFEMSVSFTVKVDKNTGARVTIAVKEYIYIGLMAKGNAKLSDWNFDLNSYVMSTTEFDFDVVLNYNGKEINIRKELADMTTSPEADSFVARYKRTLNLTDDEITLISLELFRPRMVIANIFEVGFPLEFKVKLSMNAAFSADVTYTVVKCYGLRGEKGKGVECYYQDVLQKYDYDFYFSGCVGFKAGISFSLELSFAGLSSLGAVGVSAEVGAYFDLYGHGQYRVYNGTREDGTEFVNTKQMGGYYYDLGVYLQLSLYTKSEVLFAEKDKDLAETKYPLLKGGDQHVAIGYTDLTDKTVVMEGERASYASFDVYELEYMSLVTGKTFIAEANSDDFIFDVDNDAFYIDYNNKVVGITSRHKQLDGGRADGILELRYIGAHYAVPKQWLSGFVNITYIPSTLAIDPDDIDKEVTVTFKIVNDDYGVDETYAVTKVLIGKVPIAPSVTGEWYDKNTWAGYTGWLKAVKPVDKDTVFYADAKLAATHVYYEYMGENGASQIFTVYCKVGDDPIELSKQLAYPPQNIGDHYVMTGWDASANSPVPPPATRKATAATYVMTYDSRPFEVTLEVSELKSNSGTRLLGKQFYRQEINFGDTPDFSVKVLDNYRVIYNIGGVESTSLPRIYSPTAITARLSPSRTFTVNVCDYRGVTILYREKIPYGSDVSDILQDPIVTEYPHMDGIDLRDDQGARFLGWVPDVSALSYVTQELRIRPLIDIFTVTYIIKLDANGGEIPSAMARIAREGFDVEKGKTPYRDFFNAFTPTKASTDDTVYTFDGWATLNDGVYTVVDPLSIPATEDVTYYATYKQTERLYTVKLYADGDVTSWVSDTTFEKTAVSGSFADGEKTKTYEVNHADRLALLEQIRKSPPADLIPTPDDSQYRFSRWVTHNREDRNDCYPIYKFKAKQVNLIFDMGKGKYYDAQGIFVITHDIEVGGWIGLNVSNFFTPDQETEVYPTPTSRAELCCYVEGGYYYRPLSPMAWSLDGVNPLPESEWELTLYSDSEDITFYALYEQFKMKKYVSFELLPGQRMSFDDGKGSYYRQFIEDFDTPITPDMIPSVSRKTEEIDQYHYYEFLHWIDRDTGEIGVRSDFGENAVYLPVFEKRLREITVTFDAGEYGVFPSTGTRTKSYNVLAGSKVFETEIPVYTNSSLYYDTYFRTWGWEDGFISSFYSETVEARITRVRNHNPAPETGILVSDGKHVEDIAFNTIAGYEYDPDNKALFVGESGLTFDGAGKTYDLSVYLGASTTLKDLTIRGMIDAGMIDAYGTRTLNIEGDCGLIFEADMSWLIIMRLEENAVIAGVGDDASFTLTLNADLIENGGFHIIEASGLTVENLSFNVNVDVTDNAELNIFRVVGDLALNDTSLNINASGSSDLPRYAFYLINGELHSTDSTVVINGCDEVYHETY